YNYSAVPTDSIEKLRNNLILLSNSLKKLKLDLIKSNNNYSLPDYNSLQNQYIVIVTQLSIISSILSENSHILKKTNVYPLPNSNPIKNEPLFNSLLRKKPLPEVEQWLKDSDSLIDNIINYNTNNSNNPSQIASLNNINNNKDDAFILWCFNELKKNVKNYKFFDDFTQQEHLSGQVEEIKK
ncbi:RNA polymerase II mediator complex subunit MED8 ASCRUDRAFT_16413, partial [Ascoidea rubescens DSM 1968]